MKNLLFGILLFFLFVLCSCKVENSPASTPVENNLPLTVTHSSTPTITSPKTQIPEENSLSNDVDSPIQHTITSFPTLTPDATPTRDGKGRGSFGIRTHPTFTPNPAISFTPSPAISLSDLEIEDLLKNREPSIEDVEAYLLNFPTNYYHGVWPHPNNVADDVNMFKNYRGITESVQFIYEDVNGDEVEDLIVTDTLLTAIFLWDKETYRVPFVILGSEYQYSPASKTYLEDWTGDDVPEVIFNYRRDSGGTGVSYYGWENFVIHCNLSECAVIWHGALTSIYSDYNLGGLTLFQSTLQRQIDDSRILLTQNKSLFSIYDSYFWQPGPEDYWGEYQALKVYTSTQDIYIWNGSEFDFVETKVTREPYTIEEDAVLEANHELGNAVITFENNHAADGNNDFCQLYLNEEPVGDLFGCKQNFTTVQWHDITADGQPEIIVQALSGARPQAVTGTWPDEKRALLSDISCVHQHMLIYQWDGTTIAKIADVEGCVVQDDLYGVQLSDTDSDGQVEITAANRWFTESECTGQIVDPYACWYEFGYENNIYKWNGTEFVLWDTVPSD